MATYEYITSDHPLIHWYDVFVSRCGRTGRAGNKGWAYTFLTPDQPRYGGEVIRALELSETPVPPDLQVKLGEGIGSLSDFGGYTVYP